jgi:hypothetical protein
MNGEGYTREQLAEVHDLLAGWFRGVFDTIAAAAQEVFDALGGPEGIAAIVAAKDAWEADHPGIRWGQQCHCICGPAHPDRRDACTGDADTLIRRVYAGEPYDLPVCSGCSTAILAHA